MRITSTLLLCFCFLLAVACGGSAPPPAAPSPDPAAASTSSTPLVAPGEAKVGDRTKCPVSGNEFVVKEDSPHAEHNGKTYYFCCPDCPKAFQANPEKFVPSA
jgi:YHS domain-containing protein